MVVSQSAELGVWIDKSDRAHSKSFPEELDFHVCALLQKKMWIQNNTFPKGGPEK